jgi:hypothetical protein
VFYIPQVDTYFYGAPREGGFVVPNQLVVVWMDDVPQLFREYDMNRVQMVKHKPGAGLVIPYEKPESFARVATGKRLTLVGMIRALGPKETIESKGGKMYYKTMVTIQTFDSTHALQTISFYVWGDFDRARARVGTIIQAFGVYYSESAVLGSSFQVDKWGHVFWEVTGPQADQLRAELPAPVEQVAAELPDDVDPA